MNAKLQEVHSKREQQFQHARIFTQYKDQVSAQLSKIASQICKRTRGGNELLSFYTAHHIHLSSNFSSFAFAIISFLNILKSE